MRCRGGGTTCTVGVSREGGKVVKLEPAVRCACPAGPWLADFRRFISAHYTEPCDADAMRTQAPALNASFRSFDSHHAKLTSIINVITHTASVSQFHITDVRFYCL
ncbi:hypothetical protein Ancab_036418, partial [Ancistrocladus abbreviatus]